MKAEPDTRCDLCWWAEASLSWRLLDRIGYGRAKPGPFAGLASILQAAAGGRALTWYDRHREDWIATGDERHLARMLRHV